MKTNLSMALALLALIGLSSGDAFAAKAFTVGGETVLNSGTAAACTVQTSKNVDGQYTGNLTSYSMGTYHRNGSRDYGTGSNTGVIWYQACAAPAACGESETISAGSLSSQSFATGWTAL